MQITEINIQDKNKIHLYFADTLVNERPII